MAGSAVVKTFPMDGNTTLVRFTMSRELWAPNPPYTYQAIRQHPILLVEPNHPQTSPNQKISSSGSPLDTKIQAKKAPIEPPQCFSMWSLTPRTPFGKATTNLKVYNKYYWNYWNEWGVGPLGFSPTNDPGLFPVFLLPSLPYLVLRSLLPAPLLTPSAPIPLPTLPEPTKCSFHFSSCPLHLSTHALLSFKMFQPCTLGKIIYIYIYIYNVSVHM